MKAYLTQRCRSSVPAFSLLECLVVLVIVMMLVGIWSWFFGGMRNSRMIELERDVGLLVERAQLWSTSLSQDVCVVYALEKDRAAKQSGAKMAVFQLPRNWSEQNTPMEAKPLTRWMYFGSGYELDVKSSDLGVLPPLVVGRGKILSGVGLILKPQGGMERPMGLHEAVLRLVDVRKRIKADVVIGRNIIRAKGSF